MGDLLHTGHFACNTNTYTYLFNDTFWMACW